MRFELILTHIPRKRSESRRNRGFRSVDTFTAGTEILNLNANKTNLNGFIEWGDEMSKKKKSIAALGAAIAEHEKLNTTAPTSAVQQLVEAFLSTNNPAKRQKRIAEIKSRCTELNELLADNSELLTAEVEQALIRAATGYTVTEQTVKLVNGVKTVETREKHILPSQAAMEFYLINKKGEDYSKTGGSSGNSEGKIAEIVEAFRNG